MKAMEQPQWPYSLGPLAKVVAALAPRLEPSDATRETSAAAQQVRQAMDKTSNPVFLRALAQAWCSGFSVGIGKIQGAVEGKWRIGHIAGGSPKGMPGFFLRRLP